MMFDSERFVDICKSPIYVAILLGAGRLLIKFELQIGKALDELHNS